MEGPPEFETDKSVEKDRFLSELIIEPGAPVQSLYSSHKAIGSPFVSQ